MKPKSSDYLCPVYSKTCATAYRVYRCRCVRCGAWLRKYSTWYRAAKPVTVLLCDIRKRSKKDGVEFTLTASNIPPLPDCCPVFGFPLVWGGGQSGKDNTPSLDRFDNNLGYTPGNVKWISTKANCLKRNGTLEDFKDMVAWMEVTNE